MSDLEGERRRRIAAALDNVLVETRIPGLPEPIRGKVRDSYDLNDGRRLLVATDRQSAFDQILAAVPFKGQVLTATARFWFDATRDLCFSHVLAYPDPNVMAVRRLDMLPVEIVVRDYLAGTTATSIWTQYRNGVRTMYGMRFAEGMRRNQKLKQTIVTPTTKGADGAHDVPLTPDEILAQGLLTAPQWEEVCATALALFARGREISAANGLVLVDTKYEFGVDGDGRITLADEIHTPDSSRYWIAGSYAERFAAGEDPESLDKDFLRRWIAARCDPYRDPIPPIPVETLTEFSLRYITLFERVTGERFAMPPADQPVDARIADNVHRYLA